MIDAQNMKKSKPAYRLRIKENQRKEKIKLDDTIVLAVMGFGEDSRREERQIDEHQPVRRFITVVTHRRNHYRFVEQLYWPSSPRSRGVPDGDCWLMSEMPTRNDDESDERALVELRDSRYWSLVCSALIFFSFV